VMQLLHLLHHSVAARWVFSVIALTVLYVILKMVECAIIPE